MKLVYFDDFKLGVLKDDAVVDVSAAVSDIPHTGPGDLMNGLIERWDTYKPRLETAAARPTSRSASWISARMRASAAPRQSPSSLMRASI